MTKEIRPLLDYLNKLYDKGYCVFYNLSGHVNWLEFHIAKSKEEYNEKIYSSIIIFAQNGEKIKSSKLDKNVKDRIRELKEAILHFDELLKKKEKEKEEEEKKEFERLKLKFKKKN